MEGHRHLYATTVNVRDTHPAHVKGKMKVMRTNKEHKGGRRPKEPLFFKLEN